MFGMGTGGAPPVSSPYTQPELKFATGHVSLLRPAGNAKRFPSEFGMETGGINNAQFIAEFKNKNKLKIFDKVNFYILKYYYGY